MSMRPQHNTKYSFTHLTVTTLGYCTIFFIAVLLLDAARKEPANHGANSSAPATIIHPQNSISTLKALKFVWITRQQ